jgi:hypothetical protein
MKSKNSYVQFSRVGEMGVFRVPVSFLWVETEHGKWQIQQNGIE